ncbi:MAG: patatin-like phospholipase family protein [Nitrospirales bacterium]
MTMIVSPSQTETHTGREAWQVLEHKRLGLMDTDTIGLVVQGGGMRGVYSMGALAALEEMGFTHCFDHLVGSSAGALNGAYFLTGQASYGVETYIHYLSQKSFVNPFRFKRIVDIDYLVDQIGKKIRPLHLPKLLSSPTTLHVSLTESTYAHTEWITNRTPDIDIWEAFRATAALPLLYNKSVKVGDGHYVDGSISARLPVQRMMEYDCRYVVVILTMPLAHRITTTHGWLQSLTWPATRHYSSALRQAFFGEDLAYNTTKVDLSGTRPSLPGWANRIIVISPQMAPERFSTITTNPKQLFLGAMQAREDTWRAFGRTPPPLTNPFAAS